MRRIATVTIAAVAVAALSGCILTPDMLAPPPPPAQPQPSTPADPGSTSEPGTTSDPGAGSSEVAIDVEGSTATVTADGQTWELELVELGPVPAESFEPRYPEDGVEVPEGMEIGWACFRATLLESVDGSGSPLDVVSRFAVDGGDESFDYRTIPDDIDIYSAYVSTGETVDRTCAFLEAPAGFAYDAMILEAGVIGSGESIPAAVPAP